MYVQCKEIPCFGFICKLLLKGTETVILINIISIQNSGTRIAENYQNN